MEAVGHVEDDAILSKIRHSGISGLSMLINLFPPLCSSVRLHVFTFKLVDIGLSPVVFSYITRESTSEDKHDEPIKLSRAAETSLEIQ